MENLDKKKSFYDFDTIDTIVRYSDLFIDEEFKCDIVSLVNFDDNKLTDKEKLKWLDYMWERIPIIYNSKITLLNNVSSQDVIQGSLGNCYLLSVCATIAEFPKRLEKIFLVKELNAAGIYSILFFVDGDAKKVIIDDRIPYEKSTQKPPFAKVGKNKNIWPILIEKAWAKYLGNYQNTIQGYPSEIFKILTGAPSFYIVKDKIKSIDELNAFWAQIQHFYLNAYYICASTHSSREESINADQNNLIDEIKKIGLSLNHAYSCLVFYEFMASGQKLRLVKIRNPWGYLNKSSFKGDVITKNYLNLPEIKENIGNTNEEGVLILTFEEFTKYFSTMYICKYHDNYFTYSQKIYNGLNKREHFKVFKIDLKYAINLKSKIFFSVNKPTKFSFLNDSEKSNETQNLYNSIFVGRLKINNSIEHIEFIGHSEGYESMSTVELDSYEKSEYILFVHFDRHKTHLIDPDYLGYISVYSSEESIIIEQLNSIDVDRAFQNLIYDYFRNFKNFLGHKSKVLSDDGLITMNSFSLDHSNYSFTILENSSPEIRLEFKFSDIKIDNAKSDDLIGDKYIYKSDKNNFNVFVPSNDYQVITLYKGSVKYKYNFVILKSREMIKKEAKNLGNKKTIRLSAGAVEYYAYSTMTCICYLFENPLDCMLNIVFKMVENVNLICYDFVDHHKFEFFIPPREDYSLFLDMVEIGKGFNIKYEVKADALY